MILMINNINDEIGNKAMPGTGNIPFLPSDPRIKVSI